MNHLQTRWSWLSLLLIFFADGAEDATDAKYMRRERPEGQVKIPTTKLETITKHIGAGEQLAEVRELGEEQATELSLLHGEAKAQFDKEEEELQNLTKNQQVFMLGDFVPDSAMTKHIVDLPEGKTIDEVASEITSASLLDQGYSAEEEAKKMARVELSFRHFQQTAAELDRWLENFHRREDSFDEHGFEIDRVGIEQRMQHVKETIEHNRGKELRAEQKFLLDRRKGEKELAEKRKTSPGAALEQAKVAQAANDLKDSDDRGDHGGNHAFVTGFFAKDRPNEKRLDPSNMKVYKFHDYRLRHSRKHSYDVEVMWKKLPLAPKMVYKKKLVEAVKPDRDGYSLVDEHGKELVFKKDSKGYYHQGNGFISSDDVLKASQPLTWLRYHQREKWHRKNDRFMIYPSHRTQIQSLIQEVNNKSLDQYSREVAVQNLETLMTAHRIGVHMNHKRHGKASISIHGIEGFLCGTNAEISKVTVGKLKERIENKTGIPVETQKLLMGLEELHDEDLLNKRIPPIGLKIELIRKDWKETQDGLHTRRQRENELRQKKYINKAITDESHEKKQSISPLHSSSNQTQIAERLDDLRALQTLRLHQSSPADGAGFINKKGHRRHQTRQYRDNEVSVVSEVRRNVQEEKLEKPHQEKKKSMLLEIQQKANESASVSSTSLGHMSRQPLEEKTRPHVLQGKDGMAGAFAESSAVVTAKHSQKAAKQTLLKQNRSFADNKNDDIPRHSGQYSKLESVVQFVRGRDGKIHVAKERHSTYKHPIPPGFSFGNLDNGVSVLDHIGEKENKEVSNARG